MGLIVPGAATAPGRERGIGGTCDSVASYMNYVALYSLSCNILSMGIAESGAHNALLSAMTRRMRPLPGTLSHSAAV